MNWFKRKLREQFDLGTWNNSKASKVEVWYVCALAIIAIYLVIKEILGKVLQ